MKFECEVCDKLKGEEEKDIDNLKVKVIKRVMELPYSTPSAVVKHDFGLVDLSLEVMMEKVLLAVKTLRSADERKAKQLLQIIIAKKVPGFCTEVLAICKNVLGVELDGLVTFDGDVRNMLKEKVIAVQEKRLRKQMMAQSKSDQLLLTSFGFNGNRQGYLDLPFHQAQIIFMVRCRMLLTKCNFPGRWVGVYCNLCGCLDTDEHLFGCPGFNDILCDVSYELFFAKN